MEMLWFGECRKTMSVTVTSASLRLGSKEKNQSSFKYPDLESRRRPVPHCDEIPVLEVTEPHQVSDKELSSVQENEEVALIGGADDTPLLLSQNEPNDIACDLYFSKLSVELFLLRLKENTSFSQCSQHFLP